MEKDVFDIIAEKEYDELSKQELELVQEVCASEDEYLHMRSVLLEVNAMTEQVEAPSQKTKDRLDELFMAQSFPKTAPVWYNGFLTVIYPKEKKFYKRPLIQVAAVALLLISVMPFIWEQRSVMADRQPELAVNSSPEEEKSVSESPRMPMTQSQQAMSEAEASGGKEKSVEYDEMAGDIVVYKSKAVVASDSSKYRKTTTITHTLKDANLAPAKVATGTFSAFSASDEDLFTGHSDGIFNGLEMKQMPSYSIPASERPAVLDLLTAAF